MNNVDIKVDSNKRALLISLHSKKALHMADNVKNNSKEEASGQVIEALPNAMFKVERDDTGEEQLAFLSGKMRLYKIKVLVGDKVKMQLDPYGGKARIVQRF